MITPKALRRKPIYMKPIYTNSLYSYKRYGGCAKTVLCVHSGDDFTYNEATLST